MSVSAPAGVSDIAAGLLDGTGFRAPSLIVTVWGDTIAPAGVAVWLGSLIRLAADFGLNERVVRTAVYRLQKDGWLESEQSGRRSYYRLAPSGRHLTAAADQRIYRTGLPDWDGDWLTLIAGPEIDPVRERLSRELVLQGFGVAAPGVFVRPDAALDDVREILADFGAADRIAVFRSREPGGAGGAAARELVARAWDHDAIATGYREFIALFGPLEDRSAGLPPRDAFIVRTLLVHEFRRVTLRDPMLPAELMTAGWPGVEARELAGAIYRRVAAAAQSHAREVLETRSGRLPNPGPAYYHRFGGIAGD
ncbi:MAG: phenylacetic acid degradation operon negative regulatory protein PaaX [Minwuia sp.]|uniref:phenylacetic acid degradation operon negative regulatory protein PaaX n=1 Tax=Minwuia sp. TaxID=2493630 RepID=UPI003A836CD5